MNDPSHRREINPVQRLSAYGDHTDSLRGSGAFQRQGSPPTRGETHLGLDAARARARPSPAVTPENPVDLAQTHHSPYEVVDATHWPFSSAVRA